MKNLNKRLSIRITFVVRNAHEREDEYLKIMQTLKLFDIFPEFAYFFWSTLYKKKNDGYCNFSA